MQGWNSFSTCETKVSIFIFTIVFDANAKNSGSVFILIYKQYFNSMNEIINIFHINTGIF